MELKDLETISQIKIEDHPTKAQRHALYRLGVSRYLVQKIPTRAEAAIVISKMLAAQKVLRSKGEDLSKISFNGL